MLVERDRVGRGATGHNAGQLLWTVACRRLAARPGRPRARARARTVPRARAAAPRSLPGAPRSIGHSGRASGPAVRPWATTDRRTVQATVLASASDAAACLGQRIDGQDPEHDRGQAARSEPADEGDGRTLQAAADQRDRHRDHADDRQAEDRVEDRPQVVRCLGTASRRTWPRRPSRRRSTAGSRPPR